MPEHARLIAGGLMLERVEGLDCRSLLGRVRRCRDGLDGMNLGSALAADVGHQAIFVFAVVQADGLGGLRKQVNDGSTAQHESIFIDPQATLGRAVHQEEDVEFLNALVPRQIDQIKEEKFLGQRKVFLHQPVTRMRVRRIRDDIFIQAKAHRADRFIGQNDGSAFAKKRDTAHIAKKHLVERTDQSRASVQVKAQLLYRKFRQLKAWSSKPQTQNRSDVGCMVEKFELIFRLKPCRDYFQRPESDRVAGAKTAVQAFVGLREKFCMPGNFKSRKLLALGFVGSKMGNGQGRNRIDQVRIQQAQQGRVDFRKFSVE